MPTKSRGAPSALPHANKGNALYRLGWFHEAHLHGAVKSFQRALELDEDNLPARNGLGVCLLELGDHAGAAVEFLRAVEQAPNEPDFRYNYAVACARQKRTDRAKTELAQLLDNHAGYEPARRALDLLNAPPARPDLWQAWTQGSDLRLALGIALLGAFALLVVLPIVYLAVPSIDGPALPWQYYVAALVVVAAALVLPAVRRLGIFGVGLGLGPPELGSAEAQLQPVFRQ